jgi:hypothetical protein
MEKEKLVEIVENLENKSNKDLYVVSQQLETEFNKTKDLIISLTRHLDTIEKMYNDVNDEIKKRINK